MQEIDEIKNILEECFKKRKRITSGEIATLLNIAEDDTHYRTRSLIRECAKKYKLPLAADTKGYYLIENDYEYNAYMSNLERRIQGIKERMDLITENYKGGK